MKISFTGTQAGMTAAQRERWRSLLMLHKPDAICHGGCVGADDEADAIAADLGILRFVFPSNLEAKRVPNAILKARTGSQVVVMAEKPPLVRNKDIVLLGDVLVAAPRQKQMTVRSGTWATVRYARKRSVKVEILVP